MMLHPFIHCQAPSFFDLLISTVSFDIVSYAESFPSVKPDSLMFITFFFFILLYLLSMILQCQATDLCGCGNTMLSVEKSSHTYFFLSTPMQNPLHTNGMLSSSAGSDGKTDRGKWSEQQQYVWIKRLEDDGEKQRQSPGKKKKNLMNCFF